MQDLFSSFRLGELMLPNRIVMAPMTRSRATALQPDADTALYYRQRASAGLIISEGIHVSEEARGQAFTPGIYTPSQINAWRKVTDAVHEEGGRIFAQLWHVGRNSHISHQPDGGLPVGPVATRAESETWAIQNGKATPMQCSSPRALEVADIQRITQDFVAAARNAIDAGFDGVELHGANGYLFEQFINGALNTRTDEYGGTICNRLRFPLETLKAVGQEIGMARTGIRISPFGRFGDMHAFSDEEETWLSFIVSLAELAPVYLHVSDQRSLGQQPVPEGFMSKIRQEFPHPLIKAGDFDKDTATRALTANEVDLVAFGRPFISNPDLPERFINNWPLTPVDKSTLYSQGPEGYTDYSAYHPEK